MMPFDDDPSEEHVVHRRSKIPNRIEVSGRIGEQQASWLGISFGHVHWRAETSKTNIGVNAVSCLSVV